MTALDLLLIIWNILAICMDQYLELKHRSSLRHKIVHTLKPAHLDNDDFQLGPFFFSKQIPVSTALQISMTIGARDFRSEFERTCQPLPLVLPLVIKRRTGRSNLRAAATLQRNASIASSSSQRQRSPSLHIGLPLLINGKSVWEATMEDLPPIDSRETGIIPAPLKTPERTSFQAGSIATDTDADSSDSDTLHCTTSGSLALLDMEVGIVDMLQYLKSDSTNDSTSKDDDVPARIVTPSESSDEMSQLFAEVGNASEEILHQVIWNSEARRFQMPGSEQSQNMSKARPD